MTQHLDSKRLPISRLRPGRGRVLAAVLGLVAALSLGAIGEAEADAASPTATSASADRRSDRPHGFASLAGGTTGGADGNVVTVTDQAALAKYAAAEEPYIIRVSGSIDVEPFGSDIVVTSDKTLIGVGDTGEIVHGELHLNPGTSNVIIRNLTIRDSYVEGDWDGKTTDFDAIQMDTVDHVWIDHNRFTHMGDGLLDIRKDSQYITVSYNRFSHHNKAFGIGWTTNVRTQITLDHNWFTGTKQRNPSADNCAYAHLYNNYLSAQVADGDPVWTYGNWSRGKTRMVIENSYYDGVQHPYQADATAELVERGSILRNTTGRTDEWGAAFEPREFYDYRLDPAAAVPALVKRFSGPQPRIGVTLRVPGEYPTVQAAVDAVPDEAAHELNGEQAPAMKTTGDRIVFDDTAFLGNQDTLMTDSPKLDVISRVYLRNSYIEGDVDFLYGRATTVIERSVIRALSRGSDSNNGYLTAASTWTGNRYGFLITDSKVVSDAPAGTFHLGRPWHPGGESAAVAQVLIRNTELPAAIKSSAWTDMSGFAWKDARFAEYRNFGPGAAVTADRPQMSEDQTRVHTVADYLQGTDGWAPYARH